MAGNKPSIEAVCQKCIVRRLGSNTHQTQVALRKLICESLAKEFETALSFERRAALAHKWDNSLRESMSCSLRLTCSRARKGKEQPISSSGYEQAETHERTLCSSYPLRLNNSRLISFPSERLRPAICVCTIRGEPQPLPQDPSVWRKGIHHASVKRTPVRICCRRRRSHRVNPRNDSARARRLPCQFLH